MFEHLESSEQIEAFLAEQRRVLTELEWRELVHQLAEEMGRRAVTPAAELLQKIRVYKRATDQLELPDALEPARAKERGWRVLRGGRDPGSSC